MPLHVPVELVQQRKQALPELHYLLVHFSPRKYIHPLARPVIRQVTLIIRTPGTSEAIVYYEADDFVLAIQVALGGSEHISLGIRVCDFLEVVGQV